MMNKHFAQLFSITVVTGCATPAMACNICTMAFFDYSFPPLLLWQFFPVVWYILACSVYNKNDPHTSGLVRTWPGILTGLFTIIFGNAVGVGPLPSLLLFIPLIVLSINAAIPHRRERWPEGQRKKYITVSAIGSIGLFCLLISMVYIRETRTPVEYIAQWGINGQGRAEIKKLQINAPANLDDIRLLVSGSNRFVSARLAVTLARHGDPAVDFPILLQALEKSRAQKYGEIDFEEALALLTGLNLPPDSSVNKWKSAFADNKINQPTHKPSSP